MGPAMGSDPGPLLTPLLWSLPTALMIGGSASAILPKAASTFGCCGRWEVLGISGSVAIAGGEHLRHGDLPTLFVAYLVRLFSGLRGSIADCW